MADLSSVTIGKAANQRPEAETPYVFRQIIHNSPDYLSLISLRDNILRRPLGLVFSPEDLAAESQDFHLAVFDEAGELSGGLLLHPVPNQPALIHLKQLAVSEAKRSLGLGRRLMTFAEAFAKEHGYTEIKLHARAEVVAFYTKLGYREIGERFVEVTIPHQEMRKSLT